MGAWRRRSGAWLGVVLTAAAATNCGGDGDSDTQPGPSGGSGGGAGSAAGAAGSGAAGSGAAGSSGTGAAGEGGAGGEDAGGAGGEAGADSGAGGSPPIFVTAGKVDLLFVVDNSISMGDKQTLFASSLPALVERLVRPWCVGGAEPVPPQDDGSCPTGTTQEYAAVEDLHVGVISSSLGGSAAQACDDADDDDHGHLIGALREDLTTWNDLGFLKWDPNGVATPAGENDPSLLADALADMVVATGDQGCGYEAPLEAMYRFLVDPEPPLTVEQVGGVTVASGIDEDLLAQRNAFVRPDSAVMVVVISDENDCSIIDHGQGWLVGLTNNGGSAFRMPRATAACAEDPNDECCRSCAAAGDPPDGCTSIDADPECAKGAYTTNEDELNLRCFDQKRRFGFDLLFPLSRYVDGLSSPTVKNRAGETVDNPLFVSGRHPGLVMLTVIAGVPWQDLAVDPSPEADLDFLSTAQLTAQSRWNVIVGNLATYQPPTDPFMIESVAPRSGQNPITEDPIVAETSQDPTATINGHETNMVQADDLQYACIFPLPAPIDCSSEDASCDCAPDQLVYNRALCQPPGGGAAGTTQYFGKAYPGLRLLDVARQLESQSAVASICPRNVSDLDADDYGYYPALRALQARLAPRLNP